MKGLSARNLGYMKAFAEAYPDPESLQQLVAKLPWGHNLRLLEAVQDPDERIWYARQAIEHGWSRAVLEHQIESGLVSVLSNGEANEICHIRCRRRRWSDRVRHYSSHEPFK